MREENVSASSSDKSDNLTEIEGLGRGFAKDLAKIGVHNVADLAQYKTPEDLRQTLLQQADVDIPLWRIQNKNGRKGDWLRQARKLAQQTKSEHARPEKETNSAKTPDATWREHAYFTLKFESKMDERGQQEWQTYVYREQNGGEEAKFTGVEPSPWVDWIYEQANLPVAVEPLKEVGKPAPVKSLGATPATLSELDEPKTKAGNAQMSAERAGHKRNITLKRGDQEITFKKVSNAFAVRLKRGMASDERTLESSLGRPKTAVQHVTSDKLERLDIFRLETAAELEETMDALREAPNAEVITHLYAIDGTPDAEVIPTGTITIQFSPDATKSRREELLEEFGLEIVEDIDYLDHGHTVALTAASTENPLKIAAKLQDLEEFVLAEPDLRIPASFEYRPTDGLYPSQWHLNNRGDKTGLKSGADVSAEEAWEDTTGSRQITICIIDDGFDLNHPEFNAPQKIVAPRDFGQNDTDPNPVFYDDNHGTACAGVALAEENGNGVVGLAPGCAFMPVRFESISDNAIVNYFQYAMDNGADVISCSWKAKSAYYPLSAKVSGIIRKAATQGRDGKGCVILFAAGNDGKPLNGQGYHQGFALHPDVIAVAASNSLDKRSSYSNYGPGVSICAPSDGSPGRRIVTTDRQGF